MKILVTGGTGFIGSHLCRRLVNENHFVLCLDNNFTGDINNIKDLLDKPNFKFIEHDIINPFYLNDDDCNGDIEQIYHLACPASPKAYQYDSIKTLKTNFFGTLNILGLAKNKKARVLLTSTSEIYGNPNIHPQTEEYWGNVNPIGIRSCYDEGKRISETLMMEYNRNHNVDIKIARIFNTYGPNMNKDDGRVVSNFINQMLENKDITIYGDGSQTRSFCYVDDTVEGLIRLMNNNETKGPINIGNPNEITIKELVDILLTMINTKSNVTYLDLPSDDPEKRRPNITKANTFLNWSPLFDLKDGLKYTITYFQNN
jgi:UDP-glucuronate decarboxylase